MELDNPILQVSDLNRLYVESCSRQGILPNNSILYGLLKAELQLSCNEMNSLQICLEHIKDEDLLPLLDVCMAISASEIEAVDVHSGSCSSLSGAHALALMHCIGQKLQVVIIQDSSVGKDFLRELLGKGLACQVLNLKSSLLRKLNIAGEFMQMHTLNLDFNSTVTGFQDDCFTCMPNLICLSMCETRVSNLWTTVAAISKLPSLVELRFQKWMCCNDSKPTSSGKKLHDQFGFCQPSSCSQIAHSLESEEALSNQFCLDHVAISEEVEMTDESSDDSEFRISSEVFSNASLGIGWNLKADKQKKVSYATVWSDEEEPVEVGFTQSTGDVSLKYISCHASSICFEKHYREYMIASLPQLKVLDDIPIRNIDKERVGATYALSFEHLPYKRRHKESVVDILCKREIKSSLAYPGGNQKPSYSYRNSPYFYTRSLSAAKVGSSAWPSSSPISISCQNLGDGSRSFRPRQFEYHPSVSGLMVFGTLDGEVVVINHENGKVVNHIPSLGAMNSVLGLCWLKKYPSKLIAGSDNGSLRLYDIEHIRPTVAGTYTGSGCVFFDDFDQLTSVHVNSTDELFLASGYSKDVALYDINSGRCIQVFTDMHKEHINVVKFSNHSPSIFATSSFDQDVKLWDLRQTPVQPCHTTSSSKGNVMVCFSPDDHYLLVSAVDNEVRQLLAADGRLHLNFEIGSTGSSQNYTRSYYMNGRDYIISGSCDEHVVRVCCAQTGRRLRDISLEGTGSGSGSGTSMFVQSLRGDPYRDFNMSILAAYMRPSSKSEIVKVNLMSSNEDAKEYSWSHTCRHPDSLGG